MNIASKNQHDSGVGLMLKVPMNEPNIKSSRDVIGISLDNSLDISQKYKLQDSDYNSTQKYVEFNDYRLDSTDLGPVSASSK